MSKYFLDVQGLNLGGETKQKEELLCILGKVIQKPCTINLKANYTLAMASTFLLRPKLFELFSFPFPLHR